MLKIEKDIVKKLEENKSVIFDDVSLRKLNEIYSSSNVTEFSLLNKEFKGLHVFFRCKDYYNDMFYQALQRIKYKEDRQFGYVHTEQIDKDVKELMFGDNKTVFLAIRYRNSKSQLAPFDNKLGNIINNLNVFQQKLNLLPVKGEMIENMYIIELDKRIFYHPFLISLFTSLIRLLAVSKTNTYKRKTNLIKKICNDKYKDCINLSKHEELFKNLELLYLKVYDEYSYRKKAEENTVFSGIHNNGFSSILSKSYTVLKLKIPFTEYKAYENKTFKDFLDKIEQDFTKQKELYTNQGVANAEG